MAVKASQRQLRVQRQESRAAAAAQAQADRQELARQRLDLQRLRETERTSRVVARTTSRYEAQRDSRIGVAQAKRDGIVGKAQAQAAGKVGVAQARAGADVGTATIAAQASIAETELIRTTGLSGLLNTVGDGASSLFGGIGGAFSGAGGGGGGGGIADAIDVGATGAQAGRSPLVLIGVAVAAYFFFVKGG